MTIEQIINYKLINDRIATSGQPEEDELKYIADAGYDIVINLALHDADYSLKDEVGNIEQLGMQYIHIPVIWTSPTENDLEKFFQVMDLFAAQRLFIHCAANRRVSVFLALYFLSKNIWNQDQALQHINSLWTPDKNWLMFFNRQVKRLAINR